MAQYVNDLYEGSKIGEDIDLETYLNSILDITKTTDKRYQQFSTLLNDINKATPTF